MLTPIRATLGAGGGADLIGILAGANPPKLPSSPAGSSWRENGPVFPITPTSAIDHYGTSSQRLIIPVGPSGLAVLKRGSKDFVLDQTYFGTDTSHGASGARQLYTIAYGNGYWLGFPLNGNKCYTSTDGLLWVENTLPTAVEVQRLVFTGSVFFAFTDGGTFYSVIIPTPAVLAGMTLHTYDHFNNEISIVAGIDHTNQLAFVTCVDTPFDTLIRFNYLKLDGTFQKIREISLGNAQKTQGVAYLPNSKRWVAVFSQSSGAPITATISDDDFVTSSSFTIAAPGDASPIVFPLFNKLAYPQRRLMFPYFRNSDNSVHIAISDDGEDWDDATLSDDIAFPFDYNSQISLIAQRA